MPGVAAVEAAAEPAFALVARAVRVVALVGVTQRVVADGVRSGQGFRQIFVGDFERRPRGVEPCVAGGAGP